MSTYRLLDLLLPMVLLCLLIPGKGKAGFLLLYSLLACCLSSWQGAIYMITTTLIVYGATIRIDKLYIRKKQSRDKSSTEKRKYDNQIAWTCRMALLCNFGFLALLKYLPSLPYHLLAAAGFKIDYFILSLPLGISFYTFALSGYLLDVRNKRIKAEYNFLKVALFASYYPLLIQGPICRFDQLMPSLSDSKKVVPASLYYGGLRVLWGVFKKKVVADRAVMFVDAVFAEHIPYGGAVTFLGVLFYSIMQYADFSGGIDIVLGISEMMGIHPVENFRQPYFATSLGDFWRRWHISLGTWMRDYVFYPFALSKPVQFLSGMLKKKGMKQLSRTLPAAIGNLLVFFLVGIWHGKSSNFIAWGLYNGCILAVSALLEPVFTKYRTNGHKVLRIIRTFLIVNIGWFFDRSTSVRQAVAMLENVIANPSWMQLIDGTLASIHLNIFDYTVLLLSVILIFTVSLVKERGMDANKVLNRWHPAVRVCMMYGLFILVLLLSTHSDNTGFMYAMY